MTDNNFNVTEAQTLAQSGIEKAKQLFADTEGWHSLGHKEHSEVFYKNVEGLPHLYKHVSIIKGHTADEVLAAVKTLDEQAKWDPQLRSTSGTKLVVDPHTTVGYLAVHGHLVVSARDFWIVRTWSENPHILASKSLPGDHQGGDKDVVHAFMHFSGLYLENIEEGGAKATKCTGWSQTDMKGMLPQSVTHSVMTGVFADHVKVLQKHLDGAK